MNTKRCMLVCLIASVVACLLLLSILIWLAVAHPHCTDVVVQERPATAGEISLGQLSLNLASGSFSIGPIGVGSHVAGLSSLTGVFDEMSAGQGQLLGDCGKGNGKVCLEGGGYRMTVETYSINDIHCYNVTQTKSSVNSNISTCVDFGPHHWYGAAEVHDQMWPIEKWSIDLQEFVARDPYYPGYFGSVQERYWLSTAAAAIHAPFDTPLYVSMNSSGDGKLCFLSNFEDSVYHNVKNEVLRLSLDICTGSNLTSLHMSMADKMWEKPASRPSLELMVKPIWSTWAEYKKDINESLLVEYIDKIVSHGLSISQLEIDDDWTPHYGDWRFSTTKFPNAASTIQSLKSKVSTVSVWIHPFVNTDADAFFPLAANGSLMKIDKVPGLTRWWNPGYAGLLDFSSPQTTDWFLGVLDELKRDYGVDSFKFDAGEVVWMPKHSQLSQPYFNPTEYIKHYVSMATRADSVLRRQEVRVGSQTQSAPVLVRMLDRRSRWGVDNGLQTLIPTALTFGLLGYPFVLPDMIGGNAYEGVKVEKELYIRWLQVNVFMPAIQFSIPPWHFNDNAIIEHTREMLQLRESYTSLFDRLSNESVVYGWPMMRPLWWTHPSDPVCQVIEDEFLLGNDLLVAPVVEKGDIQRDVYLPAGLWTDQLTGEELEGGRWYRSYQASLWQLPHFLRKLV